MIQKKIKKFKFLIQKKFFQELNIDGIYRLIFSFCKDNETCIKFSMISKNVNQTFKNMILTHIPTRLYRLLFLNGKKRKDPSIDLFGNNNNNNNNNKHTKSLFNCGYYVKTIDDYERKLLKNNEVIQDISKINKK